jgi:rod shape-determining protein MreC
MEFLSRYRNLSVLLLLIFAQLLLLAYQVKTAQDVRLIRVWAVTAVTPVARLLEGARSTVTSFVESYLLLHNAVEENRRLRAEIGRLKLENQYLKNELATAERARALAVFQARNPSKTVAARVIGADVGATSRVVFVDRGSTSGVMRGMAVITPDGIVGKVVAVFPTASQVQLITDPTFAAGVISEKHRVRGALKGQGHGACRVDYVQAEEKVEVGEWFYTSGDDRVFPRGLPVGVVTAVRDGNPFKEIFVAPSGLQGGLEEVLIVLEGVHLELPEHRTPDTRMYLLPPPPDAAAATNAPRGPVTDADRLLERYRAIGEAQGHKFGEGAPGSKPPDFDLDPSALPRPSPPPPKPAPAVKP